MSKTKKEIREILQNAPDLSFESNIPDNLHNIAVYDRTCAPSSDSTYSMKLINQFYQNLASKHPSWNLVEMYHDEGTGYTEFMRMCQDCKDGKFDLVITKNISRFSRDLITALERIKALKRYGIGVYFYTENIYSLNDNCDTSLRLLNLMAQLENETKSMRPCACCRYATPQYKEFKAQSRLKHKGDA